jgi:N-acyl-phosphatidylethanolamine-hydrolysing phospholipase D
VLLQIGGLNVLTDPVFSERAFPVQWMGPRRVMDPGLAIDALPPLDVVTVSHSHYDHLDRSAVKRIAAAHPEATWIVPLRLGAYIRPWGARDIIELDWWQEIEVRGLRVTATPARHFSARRLGDRNRTLWCGFAFAAAGTRAWFAGDTAYHPEFAEIGAPPGQPRPLMLGIHWGTFRLTDEPMDEPPRRTVARWREACLDGDRLWIARFGETRRA